MTAVRLDGGYVGIRIRKNRPPEGGRYKTLLQQQEKCLGSRAGNAVRPELQERKNPQGRSRLLWMAHSRRGRERALGYKESKRVR